MALTCIGNQAIALAAEIPNLDASKIVSGTINNNRLNITEFDDNKIVNDISTSVNPPGHLTKTNQLTILTQCMLTCFKMVTELQI